MSRRTAQIVVEGHTEEAFCKYLKSLFARDCGVSVDVHNARGGSPKDVVRAAQSRKGYDKTILMYDADVVLEKTWSNQSKAAGFIPVVSSPCVEGLFLELLGKAVPGSSEACKKSFSKYLDDNQKCDFVSYGKIFPKEMLCNCKHPSVNILLSVFGK